MVLRRIAILACAALLLETSAIATELENLLIGELAQLQVLDEPIDFSSHRITFPDGSERPLSEKRGKVLLVNLWAKWCIPCKEEMPHFASLQRDLGDDRFEVVALPMKKRRTKSIRKILDSWGAENLEPYGNDPQALARTLYDQGLFSDTTISFVYPTTYLVDREGLIVALREGFLNWDTAETRALIEWMKNEPLGPTDHSIEPKAE